MADLPRWASRYQLTRELWEGRERLILDPGLERLLGSGELESLGYNDSPLVDLVADLVPEAAGETDVWFVIEHGRNAAEHARKRGGVTFVGVRDGAELATEESWEAAVVDLTGLLAEVETPTPLGVRLSPALAAFVDVVSERGEDSGRSIAISAPSRVALGSRGVDLDSFVEFVSSQFPSARVFGLADAPMVAAYDLGLGGGSEVEDEDDDDEDDEDEDADHVEFERSPSYSELDELPDDEEDEYDADLDAAEATWSNVLSPPHSRPGEATSGSRGRGLEHVVEVSADRTESDEEVPIDYDNSLGLAEPSFWGWLAVVGGEGEGIPGDGLTLLELPTRTQRVAPRRNARATDRDESGLRAQLGRAIAEADRLAIDRQRLIEELDDARERIADLEDSLAEPARAHESSNADGAAGFAAREQELRWRMAHLRSQVEALTTRPVSEEEIARARANARRADAQLANPAPAADTVGRRDRRDGLEAAPSPDPSGATESRRLRAELDTLLRRLERGGTTTLELHRALRRVRDRFTRR